MVKLESSAGIIIHDKCNVNVDHWVPKSRQLVLKQGKDSPGTKPQGNSEFFIMNLKENHNTWKFVLWIQHMLMYFQLSVIHVWDAYDGALNS